MREGRRGKAISSPRGGPHDIFCVGFFFLVLFRQPHEGGRRSVGRKVDKNTIKIPWRIFRRHYCAICSNYANQPRLSAQTREMACLTRQKKNAI